MQSRRSILATIVAASLLLPRRLWSANTSQEPTPAIRPPERDPAALIVTYPPGGFKFVSKLFGWSPWPILYICNTYMDYSEAPTIVITENIPDTREGAHRLAACVEHADSGGLPRTTLDYRARKDFLGSHGLTPQPGRYTRPRELVRH